MAAPDLASAESGCLYAPVALALLFGWGLSPVLLPVGLVVLILWAWQHAEPAPPL